MPGEARLMDPVIMCCPHGGIGIITSCSPMTSTESFGAARVGDQVTCMMCGMPGTIITGSPKTIIDGMLAAREGDCEVGICCPGCATCPHSRSGRIIGYSPTTSFD